MSRRRALLGLAAGIAALGLRSGRARATEYPSPATRPVLLQVHSTTDTRLFEPVVREFQSLHRDVAIRYEELDAGELHERFLADVHARRRCADLLLSSAMDLQAKLVNDGHAAPHRSANASALPAWARWRDEAFGFTFEPAAIVYSRAAMAGRPLPRSRAALLQALRRDAAFFRGRVGTYDIERSSVGFLLASQDARLSSEFGALLEAMGMLQPRVAVRTSDLLDALAAGDLAVGYNLLGSYALGRVDDGAPLEIVYPDDYTLAVARTAVIPARASQADAAHRFLEYLLSMPGQRTLATRSRLPAVRTDLAGAAGSPGMREARIGLARPIALGPGLLVYLDRQKRQNLLDAWRSAMAPRGAAPRARPES